jgi:Icc-related predicted phosphoesterase
MARCFFAADLHGHRRRYQRLVEAARTERPEAIFLGGDLLPHVSAAAAPGGGHFLEAFLQPLFAALAEDLGADAPRVFLIPGNDDPRCEEPAFLDAERAGAWTWVHQRRVAWRGFDVYGYGCVPPTPFLLKDWDRYDVSRHLEPGVVAPEEGLQTAEAPEDLRYATIQKDLDRLAGDADQRRAIWLFHTPPYRTALDRAALDGRVVDHVPLDVHVGSIAVRRFIERRQPLVTLHGHIHESARLTGAWTDRLGSTVLISAAHDGPELALVRFDPDAPERATRELMPWADS